MQGALYQRKIVIKVASSRLIALAVSDVNPDLALQYASQVNTRSRVIYGCGSSFGTSPPNSPVTPSG